MKAARLQQLRWALGRLRLLRRLRVLERGLDSEIADRELAVRVEGNRVEDIVRKIGSDLHAHAGGAEPCHFCGGLHAVGHPAIHRVRFGGPGGQIRLVCGLCHSARRHSFTVVK